MQIQMREEVLDPEIEFDFRDMCTRMGVHLRDRVAELIRADVERYREEKLNAAGQ